MASDKRSIRAISVPLKSDVSGFSKGLASARKDADKFHKDTSRSFSLMGKGISESVDKATVKLKALGSTNLGLVTKGMAGLAAAAVASAAAIATIGFKRIGDLGKDALAIGTTAESLSRLRGVARATGVDFNDMGEFVKGLTSDIHDSIGKTTAASEAFKALGTTAEELEKLTPDEQIKKLNQGFAALPDDAKRAEVAMRLAGQNGVKMFRMLTMGSKDFQSAMDNAPIVTDEDVSEVRKLQIAMDKLVDTVAHLADVFTTTLAPKIATIADVLTGVASKFGVVVSSAAKAQAIPSSPATKPQGAAPAPSAKLQAAAANQQAQAKEEAEAAQRRVAELQKQVSKPPMIPAKPTREAQQQALDAVRQQGKAKLEAQKQAADAARAAGKEKIEAQKQAVDAARAAGKEKLALQPQIMADARKGLNAPKARINRRPGRKDRERWIDQVQELNAAKENAQRLANGAKSPSRAMADAARLNLGLVKQVADLKQEQRESIQSSGKDEIHRRVDEIKGISSVDRKALIQGGYRAREAGKTTALRDEIQESTKLPIEKLGEDLARISRMAALGPARGGLTKAQAIRAAAQKTADSGIAGGQMQFAGTLQSNSVEGRSYLLSQTIGRPQDAIEVARQGVQATMQGNGYLSRIVGALGRPDVQVSF